jgi:squalene synthase HpnC
VVSTTRLASLTDAYVQCQRLAREHPENFPVASWLLPRHLRPHVAAIYTFARIADDFADEPGRDTAARLALLEEWERMLQATNLLEGKGQAPLPDVRHPTRGAAPFVPSIFAALANTRHEFHLPIEPFEDLLSAFRQDVVTTRYETWQDVFDYCRRSANPVGWLVLRLFGYNSPQLDRHSDAVCTALQLTNFWQDFAIDWSRGRLYLPSEEWRAAGADPADLDRGRLTPAWQTALQRAGARTRALFESGQPVADAVHGRLRHELRATWLGGLRILERLERNGFDVFQHRPALGFRDGLVIAWRTARWTRAHS